MPSSGQQGKAHGEQLFSGLRHARVPEMIPHVWFASMKGIDHACAQSGPQCDKRIVVIFSTYVRHQSDAFYAGPLQIE
jgi:hypothetical protein